jgi:PEP-CTERM motif
MKSKKLVTLLLSLSACIVGRAQIIVHTPADAIIAGVTVSPIFGPLATGGALGTSLIAFGVDYTFGNIDGIFNDPPNAFGGVNGSGNIDLLAAVDGRIVVLNTLNLGLTDFVSVDAGISSAGDLLLSVFDSSNILLASVLNTSSGISTLTIDRLGVFDIAYFTVSTVTNDLFGVQSVTINTPQPAGFAPVPEPSTYGLMGVALLGAIACVRRRLKR